MRLQAITFVLTLSLYATNAFADAEAGQAKSMSCMACHGIEGVSNNDMWPNLAGQKRGYLIAQIKAYQTGLRKDPMMMPMVKGLTETDIENLADYYSSLKP